MTREVFNAQLKRLIGLKFAPASLDTHWEALHELPEAELEAAVSIAVKACDDFPSPAELRRLTRAGRPVSGCWYRHTPPCATSSECREKFFKEAKGA
jgi:hypothetical protein